MSLEEFIKNLTKEEIENINKEFAKKENKKTSYQYSKIRDIDLEQIVEIERNLDRNIFKTWFNNDIKISKEVDNFLEALISDNDILFQAYSEEDLKINFIAPLLKKVNFKSFENKFRDFYEHTLLYESKDFILKGIADFVVSKGLARSKKPYFFIQEFKRSEDYSNPRPQLLAELISAVELNNWKMIKGAYIVGAIWNFVILEKLGENSYQYFVSENFDSSKIHDLRDIYKHLSFVKEEIIEMIKRGD